MSRYPARLLLLFGVSLGLGCGAEGTPAPEPSETVKPCLTLEEHLPKTLAALSEGRAEGLRVAIQAAGVSRGGEDVRALLDAAIALIGEVWRQLQDEDVTLPFDALNAALTPLEPQLVAALRYLATPGPTQTATFELLVGLIETCPPRSVTDALVLLLSDPTLIGALGQTLSDPTVQSIIDALPTGDASEGLVPLIRALIRAINSPNFVFDDLTALIDPLFDLDVPPFDALLPPLSTLLSGDNLTTIRALTVCMDESIVTSDGRSGSDALGALLLGLLNAPGVDLGALLSGLDPALALVQDPNTTDLIESLLAILQRDDAVRENLKPILLTLFSPTYGPGVLQSLSELIQSGAVPELTGAIADFLDPACRMMEPAGGER